MRSTLAATFASMAFAATSQAATPFVAPPPSFPVYGQELNVEIRNFDFPHTFPPRATRCAAT
jgi:hypothetical protein